MQSYAVAKLSSREGHALLRALAEEVKRERLATPVLGAVLARMLLLATLLAAALWLAWFGDGGQVIGAYAALALLLAQFAFIGHAHLPDHWPQKYGTTHFQPPESYLGQLAYPFRRRGKATPYG